MMKVFAVAIAAVSMFGLASCGDDGGASSKGDFANAIIASAKEEGVVIDEGCVKDTVNGIPDDDFKLIQENYDGIVNETVDITTIGLSDDAMMAFVEIFNCAACS